MDFNESLYRSTRGTPELRIDRRPDLTRVRRGVYADRSGWIGLPWWEKYRLRVEAFRLVWPNAVLSHESAAIAHGLPLFTEPRFIHAVERDRAKTGGHGDLRKHELKYLQVIAETELGLATSLSDTAVDVVRNMNPAHALAVWDAALRRGASIDAMHRAVSLHANTRGTRTISWVAERAVAEAESPGESVSRALVEWLGFPQPELQAAFRTPEGSWRSDLYWKAERVIGEFDGYGKYSIAPDSPLDALKREKRREDSLRRSGFRIARWEFEHLRNPSRLAEVLQRSGLALIRPPDTARLSAYVRTVAAG